MSSLPQRAQSNTETSVNRITQAIIGAAMKVHSAPGPSLPESAYVVEDRVIVELKWVEKILPVQEAQLISYLRLSRKSVGLLIHFHVRSSKDGIKRFVEGPNWQ